MYVTDMKETEIGGWAKQSLQACPQVLCYNRTNLWE